MLQHRWNLTILFWAKKARKDYIVYNLIYIQSRMVKSIEKESGLVVA